MRGFSLLEILVSLAIFGILAGVTLPWTVGSYTRIVRISDRETVRDTLERARGEALTDACNKKSCDSPRSHGVQFTTNSVVIFEGESYENRDTAMDEPISIGSEARSSGNYEYVFEADSGLAIKTGTTTFTDINGKSYGVAVNAEGAILSF